MFALSIVALVWTVVVAMSVYDTLMETRNRLQYRLHNASIVMYSKVIQDMYRKDVTAALPQVVTHRSISLSVGPILHKCVEKSVTSAAPEIVPAFPVYLDISYSLKKPDRYRVFFFLWPFGDMVCHHREIEYRCLYRIPSLSSKISYPPVPLQPSMYPTNPSSIQVKQVTLIVRYMNHKTLHRQLSCVVTPKILGLQGPLGDYHKTAHPGYQLDKRIVVIVLADEISMILKTLCTDNQIPHTAPRPPPSLGSKPPSPICAYDIKTRLRFHLYNGMTEVIDLDDCLAV